MTAAKAPDQNIEAFRTLKTLFIVVDSGMSIRNILRTDAFKVLRGCKNLRIVIFSPLTDEEFKKEVGGENIFVEPLQKWKPNPVVKSLRSFRKDLWSEQHETVRFREKREARKGRFTRALLSGLFVRDRSSEGVDKALARIYAWELKLTPVLAREYFEKYRPDLVLYSTMYAKDPCVELAARQHNVKAVAYILSWDNPTTKGPFPMRPDRAIVWNEIMRHELVTFHEIAREHVFVSGPPQFDIYTEKAAYQNREQFFRKWKLDPAKKLITYTTGTVGMFPYEHEVAEQIYQQVRNGAFKQPCQLMVRLHPKDVYEPYRRFENLPDLILQMPGRRGNTNDSWNPSREDMYELGETMAFSDVIVNIASTTTIDASCFDTPVVNLAFDRAPDRPVDKPTSRIYKFNHYKKIVETGGVKIADDIKEAVAYIQRYLDDPSLEKEGRARIREEQCYKFDGKCGERIARYLIELLEDKA